ncbi:chemotaxis protein CheA [Schnuerera sp. xch1]|uniref:chemotaxis protein CheA n=1 Tax=Schnuerera sp. xch1 TaxID=2874283 RepID=UPI001CC0D5B8|nr:chemotaxis protein CheA [Schnuerera sp. xch1]MBZ2173853.1 chemotaxis protein CheA [Schnuerera sp. xch1]
MDLDLNQYISLFIEESREHLQNMNEALLDLEKDTTNISLINEIFRVAHTLKGMSGTMGFTNMANLTHEMENVLQEARNDEVELTEGIIDILFECFDLLDESVNYIATNGEENDNEHKELVQKLKVILNKDKDIANKDETCNTKKRILDEFVLNVAREALEKELNAFTIDITLSENCMLKSARSFIIFNTLESMGDIIYSNPSAEDIEDEKFDLDFSIAYITKADEKTLMEKLNNISEIEDIKIDKIDVDNITSSDKEDSNRNHNKSKENSYVPKKSLVKNDKSKTNKKNNRIGKTVRVDIERLDNLMNLVSELIIIRTRMNDLSEISNNDNMTEAIEYLERITTSLHDSVMKVRMVPVERVFNRFPRMVRDLSKELNKKVNLEMQGKDTEVDRTVIDEIGDPLIHIIRNSLDHGIEIPEVREKLGKPREGNLTLKAYPDGNNVVIEVIDDGGGIEFDKIRNKSIEKGIITEQESKLLSEEELKSLIFEPGFSTSEKISDISGRGVGLDVVKNKIESINGSIELESKVDKGTQFIIRIPLTLAIIQALLVRLRDEIYAIPLSSITEITNVKEDDIRNIQDQEIVLYRDKTIPVVRLDALMGLDSDDPTDEYIVVVVRKGEKQSALLVNDLIGQQEIVIKPLGKYLSNIKYLSGATILGNGNISLILDVNSLV